MLSDREKEEMLEMAASSEIRAASERLRRASQPASPDQVDFEGYLAWLTSMANFGPGRPEEPHVRYERALL